MNEGDDRTNAFDQAHAHAYAERPPRQVPGFDGLHRMTSMLLGERVPEDGHLLVLGAGGGLEIKSLGDFHPAWTFEGIDPSAEMLSLAKQIASAHLNRIRLHTGYIDTSPEGPFDGAVCLLTLHFVPRQQRLETLRQVHRRLRPGAPFIVAHISFPQTEPERSQWTRRHVIFGGVDPQNTESAQQAISTRLSILSPDEDEDMLRSAGFSDVTLFYAGLSFRGWVCYA